MIVHKYILERYAREQIKLFSEEMQENDGKYKANFVRIRDLLREVDSLELANKELREDRKLMAEDRDKFIEGLKQLTEGEEHVE